MKTAGPLSGLKEARKKLRVVGRATSKRKEKRARSLDGGLGMDVRESDVSCFHC